MGKISSNSINPSKRSQRFLSCDSNNNFSVKEGKVRDTRKSINGKKNFEISRTVINRLINEIINGVAPNKKISIRSEAVNLLHIASESYLIKNFEMFNIVKQMRGANTLQQRDIVESREILDIYRKG